MSFDNFLITYMRAGSDVMTIPVHIHPMIRFEFTPKIHAVSTVIIFISITLVLVTQYFTGAMAAKTTEHD